MNLGDMKGYDELEKTDKERTKELLLKNQKNFHAVAQLLGMDDTFDLMGHLAVPEYRFDPDEGCPVISCRHCGACGGNDELNWKEIKDENGKQLVELADELSPRKLKWEIDCGICGEKWEEFVSEIT